MHSGSNVLKSFDDEVKVGWREVPLDNPLVQNHIMTRANVMVHRDDRFTRGHHWKLYSDEGGLYVRMAKRGQCKRYLDRCEITFLNGEPTLFQFRVRKDTKDEG